VHRVPLRRARGAGRTKPPEEHYAEADGLSGRWTKAFPARRIFYSRALVPGSLFFLSRLQSKRMNVQFDLCEKKTPQFATSPPPKALTGFVQPPSVRLAPSTECLRLMTLRVTAASAEVSRIVGRRLHRLGAFSLDLSQLDDSPQALRQRLGCADPTHFRTAPRCAGRSQIAETFVPRMLDPHRALRIESSLHRVRSARG